MESVYDKYESVIGLEVHIQLLTNSKAYSSDSNEFGALPNTNVSTVTFGHPGTLPVVNKKSVEFAIRLGLAIKSDIQKDMYFARKNYFYADLPKGYQITQDKTPICVGGEVLIKDKDRESKIINITQIHMEEDAGKSIHDQDPFNTLIDLNRAGVPLLEIVSEPELSNSTEAYNYLGEIRKLVRYLEICDGNMEEGSLRCDANISVRIKGQKKLGERCEVKNMNSLRNVQKAIDFEIERQIDIIDAGGVINTETRSFDAPTGTTFSLRSKELAHDYRFFPEPDLQPVVLTDKDIDNIRKSLPQLPNELYTTFTKVYGLSDYDAINLTDNKEIAIFFEELAGKSKNYKAASNQIMGPVKSYLNTHGIGIGKYPISTSQIAEVIDLIDTGSISSSAATQKLYPLLYANPNKQPKQIASNHGLLHSSDESEIETLAKEIIAKWPDKVAAYKSGKKNLLGMFMGDLMKASKGKADPKVANQLLIKLLNK
jgi:aspartyl-tRNA(Asn)/glutamyl-tRNA(Gln) amidotransferase subunit B